MENKPLRERIAQETRTMLFSYNVGTDYVEVTSSNFADQILNLLKEELDGLTVATTNPYHAVPSKTAEGIYEAGKEAQLSHTIKELKNRLGLGNREED